MNFDEFRSFINERIDYFDMIVDSLIEERDAEIFDEEKEAKQRNVEGVLRIISAYRTVGKDVMRLQRDRDRID